MTNLFNMTQRLKSEITMCQGVIEQQMESANEAAMQGKIPQDQFITVKYHAAKIKAVKKVLSELECVDSVQRIKTAQEYFAQTAEYAERNLPDVTGTKKIELEEKMTYFRRAAAELECITSL